MRSTNVSPPPPSARPSEIRAVTEPQMSLVAVGLDAATEATLVRALGRGDRVRVTRKPDLAAARAALDESALPAIVVVEAHALDARVAFPAFVHVVALAGPDRTEARALGADEIVRRPLHADELGVRLHLAARALSRDFRATPLQALRDALEAGLSGELIVSRPDDVARVHLEAGRVAWVHRPSRAVSIRGLLQSGGIELAEVTARDLADECRRTRRHFADVVVDWEIAPREAVRELLRVHLAAELAALMEGDATATFVEERRASTSTFSFGLDEVWSAPRRHHRVPTMQGLSAVVAEVPQDPACVESWLDRVAAVPDVLGCALVDTRIGRVLGARGSLGADADVVWEMAGTFSALGADADELLATAKTEAYLVRSARPAIPAVGVITFDPRVLSPAMARLLVGKAV